MSRKVYSHRIIIPLVIFLTSLLLFSFVLQSQRKISVSVTNRVLREGKLLTIKSDLHYNFDIGNMIAHYTTPFEYYFLSDARGEVRIFYPDKNEVFISRDPSQITDQSLLYFFLSNRISDLGLRSMGFSLFNTERSGRVVTSWWSPPPNMAANIQKIELVHENHLPIYMAYHKADNTLLRKVFYYDYTTDNSLPVSFPQKVLEYNYMPNGDSLVSQIVFSNILYGSRANSPLFNFKIPSNAKVVE